jgi:hypothetical protein
MPSFHHEALLQLFRNRAGLAPSLLRDALHKQLPPFTNARIESADLSNIQPAEYRADLVVLLLDDEPVFGIVIEVQLARDEAKQYAWPAYVANLRARIRCPVCLLVITADEGVARWAATPIQLGGDAQMTPYVLSPDDVPLITDAAAAKADPEMAVLSVMAHGRRVALATSVQMAEGALAASEGLDAERVPLYVDLVFNYIPEDARWALQAMKPANYEFQSEFARRYFSLGKAEGKAEGEAKGKAELLLRQATLKFGPLAPEVRARIHAATSAELDEMAERLLGASTFDAIFRAS